MTQNLITSILCGANDTRIRICLLRCKYTLPVTYCEYERKANSFRRVHACVCVRACVLGYVYVCVCMLVCEYMYIYIYIYIYMSGYGPIQNVSINIDAHLLIYEFKHR